MQEAVNRIFDRYPIEKRKEFAKNKLSHFLRSDVSSMIEGIVDSDRPDQFKVSAFAGQGNGRRFHGSVSSIRKSQNPLRTAIS